jgi:hypothetical protein
MMPESCSCGAQLPPDALFCHKCGKPQREILTPEVETLARVDILPPPLAQPAVAALSFRNIPAVRIALMVAATATILGFFLPFLNWLAAGFFAVFFYRRRTGLLLNVSAGVKMGWITGVLAFVLSAISFTIQVLPNLSNLIQERLKNLPGQDPALVQQMARFFQSGPGMATAVMFSLAAMFILITMLSMAGGALAAKLGRH